MMLVRRGGDRARPPKFGGSHPEPGRCRRPQQRRSELFPAIRLGLGGSNATGSGKLVALTDASGHNAPFTGTPTVLVTAANQTAFRGVAFAPQ